MRTRVLRTVGLMFGLSLMLTACDPASFFDFFGGGAAEPPAEAEEPGVVPVGEESDPVGEESPPVGEESPPVGEESPPVGEESPPEEDGHDEEDCRNRNHDHDDEDEDEDEDAAEAGAEV